MSAPLAEAKQSFAASIASSDDAYRSALFRDAERQAYRPEILRAWISELRKKPERGVGVSQAYWHSNGFAKVTINDTPDLCTRLHIWPAGENRLGEVDPHNHRWEFVSWVAIGAGMQERRFAVVADDEPEGISYTQCVYGRREGVAYLYPVRESRLCEVLVLQRPPSQIYSCPLKVLHTVSPIGDDLVATVVLQGPRVKESTDVYRCSERSQTTLEEPIPAPKLDELLAEVESRITAPNPVSRWSHR